MKKINTDHLKELAETMDLIAQHQLDKASQIYYCVVKSVNNNQCTIIFNNKQYTVPYYGGKPTPNKTYAIFLPHNNMNESFVIGDGGGGGGGGGSGIAVQPNPPTGDELVWIDTDDPGTIHIIPEIDDNNVSTTDTWSSQKIANEIAEANDSGTNYCKMPDGTLMCWGSFDTGTLNANVAWGSLYETPAISVSVAFPVRFSIAPCVWYKCRTTSSQCFLEDATIVSTTGIGGSIYLYRPSSTSVSAFVQWLAIGRWK